MRREGADEHERHVPVAAIDGAPFDGFRHRVDDVAQAIALPMIGPQGKKDAFRFH